MYFNYGTIIDKDFGIAFRFLESKSRASQWHFLDIGMNVFSNPFGIEKLLNNARSRASCHWCLAQSERERNDRWPADSFNV